MLPVERFAKNLRQARIKRGLTQEALENASGLDRSEISLLERARREPRLSTIVRLARALKMPPKSLLDRIE
jgi:XRE family transcriptional regulator, regulator of sulfur utilization